jgi:hypothetical protein
MLVLAVQCSAAQGRGARQVQQQREQPSCNSRGNQPGLARSRGAERTVHQYTVGWLPRGWIDCLAYDTCTHRLQRAVDAVEQVVRQVRQQGPGGQGDHGRVAAVELRQALSEDEYRDQPEDQLEECCHAADSEQFSDTTRPLLDEQSDRFTIRFYKRITLHCTALFCSYLMLMFQCSRSCSCSCSCSSSAPHRRASPPFCTLPRRGPVG